MCKVWVYLFLTLVIGHHKNLIAQIPISYATSSEKELINSSDLTELTAIQTFANSISPSILKEDDFIAFYETHYQELSKKIRSNDSDKKKASIIFDYLHKQVFKKYELEALVPQLVIQNTYNCVTATALFVSYAEAFNIPFKIYETPSHVYASIINKNKEIIVELTAPNIGFDLKLDYETMIQVLIDSKLISRDDVANKGAKNVYHDYINATKPISKKQLLAIQYHNDGIIYAKQKNYLSAYNQMNKAIKLYPNKVLSKAYSYIVSLSQLDFTLGIDTKYELLRSMLNSTKNDSLLTYSLVNHLGELTEDLLKQEENFERVEQLLTEVEEFVLTDDFISSKIEEYKTYMYTVFAQNASLRGNTIAAKKNLEQALLLDSDNIRLKTYYVSVASSYALKLSQTGLFQKAKESISELEQQYPTGYPIIADTKVQIILNSLVPLTKILANKEELVSNLLEAHQLAPDNIYLKSFAADVFHELAMQEIRRANYKAAKSLILEGLSFDSTNQTLRSDLDLINDMLK